MRLPAIIGAGFIVLIGLYALWPSTAHINPSLPQPGIIAAPLRENSALIVPIEVGFSKLDTVIEEHFPDGEILHRGHKQESDTLSYRYTVRRWGPSSFKITDGALELTLPLRVDATGRKDICLGFKKRNKCNGIQTHESGDATAYVDAKALIALIVTEDYQIEVGSNVTQELTNRPHINMDLFGNAIRIKINIEGEVEKLLAKQEGKVTKVLDKLLSSQIAKLDLRATLEKHWQTVRSPIPLGNDAWISVNPKEVLFKGIHQLSDDRVALGFGFSGPTSLSLTKPETPSPTPLPPVATAFAPSSFNLSVPLTSAFEDLNRQARSLLTGRTFEKDGYWLTVQNISLTGATLKNKGGEDRSTLIASVAFQAGDGAPSAGSTKAQGTMHLTFMPSIDTTARMLEVVDVAATSDTLNLLEAAGVGWLNSKFTPEIIAQLRYNYGEQIDIWQPRLNAKLDKGVTYQGFTITGELTDVALGGFYVSGDRLEVYLSARGTVAATVDSLNF